MNQLPVEPIPLAAIEDDGGGLVRFRHVLGDLDALVFSIKEYGLMSPPVVWRVTDRSGGKDSIQMRYILIEGNRRVAAIRQLEKDWASEQPFPLAAVACCVRAGGLDTARLLSIQAHVNRDLTEGTNRGDEAVAVKWLLKAGWEPKQIEGMLGVSQPWVSYLKTLGEYLTPEAMDALRNGHISMQDGLALVKASKSGGVVDKELQNVELATKVVENGKSTWASRREPTNPRSKAARQLFRP